MPDGLGRGETQVLFEAGQAAAKAQEINGVPFAVVPDGYEIKVVDVEKHQTTPSRPRGSVVLRDVEAFIDYVNHEKSEATCVFRDGANLTAAFNHYGGWGDHIARFEARYTVSWTAWQGFDTKWLTQEDFANFLEERLGDVAEPDGATLLTSVTALKINRSVVFESNVKLSNGQVQLRYHEDLDGGSGPAGDILLPAKLTLGLTPFEGAPAFKVAARLRWALEGKNAKFRYLLGEEARRVMDEAMEDIVSRCPFQVIHGRVELPPKALS